MIEAISSSQVTITFAATQGADRTANADQTQVAGGNRAAQNTGIVRAATPQKAPPPPPPPPPPVDKVELNREAQRAQAPQPPATISQVVKDAANGDFRALAKLTIVG